MNRTAFLTVASIIALLVGVFALALPNVLLEGKGVTPDFAVTVWVREVGIAIFAIGVMTFLVRKHRDSPTMRAFLIANGLLQLGLFPIELIAFANGTITKPSGVIPNSILHVVLAFGFLTYARRMPQQSPQSSRSVTGE